MLEQAVLIETAAEFRRRFHDLVEDSGFGVEIIFLLEKSYPYMPQEGYLSTGVGLVLARQNAQQGSLACAVRGDKSNLVAFVDIESDMFEKNLRTV